MKQSAQVGLYIFSAISCLFLLLWLLGPSHVRGEGDAIVFSTWESFEPDKCASIWLIKRFINHDSKIKFYPKGEPITEGIAFDTPDAQFRRYHNMSTYESLLQHYGLKDPKLIYMGKIMHDIEINTWGKKLFEETWSVQGAIVDIILLSTDKEEIIRKSSDYFDALYEKINP